MKTIKFKVIGKAKTKERPRFTQKGFIYTPKTTVDYEQAVRNAYIEQANGFSFGKDKPVYLRVVEYRIIPKSFSKKKREQALNDEIFPIQKPDVDNITKIVMDALNQVAYYDDGQVIAAPPIKLYSKNDMAYIDVYMCEMNKDIVNYLTKDF